MNEEQNIPSQPTPLLIVDQPVVESPKKNAAKMPFIILGAVSLLLVAIYFGNKLLTKSGKDSAIIEGASEKMIVVLPSGYQTLQAEKDNSQVLFIFDNKENYNNQKCFSLVYMGENQQGDAAKGYEKYKTALEKLSSKTGKSQVTELAVNGSKVLKNEGEASATEKITEYYIFTNKSVFIINRIYPSNEMPFNETDFQKIVNSFKVLPK